jgi:hypothetical protein
MNRHTEEKNHSVEKRAKERRKEDEHYVQRSKLQEHIKELTFNGVHFVHYEGRIELHLARDCKCDNKWLTFWNEEQFLGVTIKDVYTAVIADQFEINEKQKRRITILESYINALIRQMGIKSLEVAGLVPPVNKNSEES